MAGLDAGSHIVPYSGQCSVQDTPAPPHPGALLTGFAASNTGKLASTIVSDR